MISNRLKTVVIKQTSKQLNSVKSQLLCELRADVGEVIVATDAEVSL